MADDEQLDQVMEGGGESGASKVEPRQCSALRKNGFVVIKGRPCKIVEMSTSKTGKHGHAKVHIVALDIFNGRKMEDLSPSTHNMDVPYVSRTEYQLINISDDDYLSLMPTKEGGDTREDIKLPEGEMGDKLRTAFDDPGDGKAVNVVVLSAMGEEQCSDFKIVNE